MSNANVAKRQGAVQSKGFDLSALAIGLHSSKMKEREAVEAFIEAALKTTRQLRLAGTISRQGADEISNSLIMALAVLEHAI